MEKRNKRNIRNRLMNKGNLRNSIQKPPVKKPKSTNGSEQDKKKEQQVKAQY